jgi:hypothetical protein
MTQQKEPPRRRAPRLPTQIAGSLRGRTHRDVTVVDLSLTGCLVRCGSLLDQGAILDLDLHVTPDAIGAKVRVTGASLDGAAPADGPPQYLTGLQFLGLSAREEARLRHFLEEERRRRSADASPQ